MRRGHPELACLSFLMFAGAAVTFIVLLLHVTFIVLLLHFQLAPFCFAGEAAPDYEAPSHL